MAKHQLDTDNTTKTTKHIKTNRTNNGISHSHKPEQLQGCVGIPKCPIPNRQQSDGAKNRPNPNKGPKQTIQNQETARCFQPKWSNKLNHLQVTQNTSDNSKPSLAKIRNQPANIKH